MTPDVRQQAFRRMLAREAGTAADAPAIAAAARRSCERLAQHLTPLIGKAGVAAIYARSLHLAHRQFPWLASVGASDQGDEPFTRLQASLAPQEPGVATEAAVLVLATVGDLLVSFIGESLTAHFLRGAWPDDFAADSNEETIA
jgi:hypothetical protein